MIKNLRDARIIDGVPKIIAEQDWVIIVSRVTGLLQEKLMDFADKSQIYTAIDTLPEKLLDILAIQWKVEWYDNDYDIEQKRRVIKSAIKIRRQMGTVAAVRSTLESIFKSAKVVEWFESGEEPGTFGVDIFSSFNQKDYETFGRLIDTTKRMSAHLKSIRSVSDISDTAWIGSLIAAGSDSAINNNLAETKETYVSEPVLVAGASELNETYTKIFTDAKQSDLSEQMLCAGMAMECTLVATLHESKDLAGEINTVGKIGCMLEAQPQQVL